MVRSLRVAQRNLARGRANTVDFAVYGEEHRYDVLLMQEPYVYAGSVRGVNGWYYRVVSCRGPSNRVAIAIRVGWRFTAIEELRTELGVCVEVRGLHGTIYFVSLYCPPGQRLGRVYHFLDRVREIASGGKVLIGMDANATSALWFSKGIRRGSDPEVRGRGWAEYIVANRLEVRNEPSEWYTFSGPGGQSYIDVTLTMGNWGTASFNWRVVVEGSSDHNLIEIVIGTHCVS